MLTELKDFRAHITHGHTTFGKGFDLALECSDLSLEGYLLLSDTGVDLGGQFEWDET